MRLNEKKEHILDFIVRDYIDTAIPVSSGKMASRKVLGSSSATLRNLMLELDEDGFLFQPHTSAGRAPTEKGYRYFVDNIACATGSPPSSRQRREFSSVGLEALVDNFASELGIFTSAMIFGERGIQELAGFHDVLSEPEFREEGMLENFGQMVDDIEEVMNEYREALIGGADNYDIWIGKENIYPGARKGSVIVARVDLPKDGELLFFSYGPTRMDYEKAILKIKKLTENI
jgi:transcriptional regulator of heat shock response